MNRLLSLITLLCITMMPCFGGTSQKAVSKIIESHATGDGHVTFYRPDKNERQTFIYRDNEGNYKKEVLKEINHFFRCRLTGEEYPIDTRLIEILATIKDHFGGKDVKLISTYRSPTRNALMRRAGRKVAKDSLHMKGMAADIEIDGVSPSSIRDYAYSLQQGGVGFYGNNSFVHVDTGTLRTWGWKPKMTTKVASK